MNSNRQSAGAPVAAVLFEPYGTLIDIETDERDWYAYLNLSRFLEYRSVYLSADELRWLWFEKTARQLRESGERFPDINARAIWQELYTENARACNHIAHLDRQTFVADLTTLHRALTRRSLRLMEGVQPLLKTLRRRVRLGIVVDGQREYVLPELQMNGIDDFFEVIVVSGEYGYRKPDPRLFAAACTALGVPAAQTLFVGVDTGRDITGAREAGMRTALVLTPYGSKDIALGEPDDVVDRSAEIAALVERLSRR